MLVMIAGTKYHKSVIAMSAGVLFLTSRYLNIADLSDFSILNLDFVVTFVAMSIFASFMRISGIFQFLVLKAVKKSEWNLKKLIRNSSFVMLGLAAFFCDRVAVVSIFPIIAFIFDALNVEFNPALLGFLNAAGIGGTLLSISGAEVILIGSAAKIDFLYYFINVTPAIFVAFLISIVIINKIHVKYEIDTSSVSVVKFKEEMSIRDNSLFSKLILIIVFTAVMLFLSSIIGISNSVIILSGATLLFLMIDIAPDKILSDVKLNLFFYIFGLHIVSAAFFKYHIYENVAAFIFSYLSFNPYLICILILISGLLFSIIFGRLPAAFFFIPVISCFSSVSKDLNIMPFYVSFIFSITFSRAPTMLREIPKVLKNTHIDEKKVWTHFLEFIKDSILIYILSIFWFAVYIYLRYYYF